MSWTNRIIVVLAVPVLASVMSAAITSDATADPDPAAIVKSYADIGLAKYEDALMTAKVLDMAIDAFVDNPSPELFENARNAWIAARVPYQQTEAYRFGNPIVDDWEGRVNSWPLDEGLIDYVDPSYGVENDNNELYTANVIANPKIRINGKDVDASAITPEFLSDMLHEAGGIEANVATGYHAIEFLLWGQDLNGSEAGSGARRWTDYARDEACTNDHCDRRARYLASASDLLVADLEEMAANWAEGGAARKDILARDTNAALLAMLTGMGSLSYGELAGERMKLGLLLHDPEEEHDCFSDNTHNSHLNDAIGIRDVYLGRYKRMDGSTLSGPSLSELVATRDAALDEEMRSKLTATVEAMQAMATRAETVETYDQMIAEANEEGNATVQAAIDGLIAQTKTIEQVINTLDLGSMEIEGSDSLDNPGSVFQ